MSLISVPNILVDLAKVFAIDWNKNFLAITNALNGSVENIEFKWNFNGATPVLILNQKGSGGIFSVLLGSISLVSINNVGQINSVIGSGLAPFILASTTKVANLNVDKWDDLSSEQIIQLIGGIVTGNVTCHADPASNMQLSTKQYADSKSVNFMASGTKLLFGTNPPAGWTRNNAAEDRLLRLSKAADAIGTAAGDWFFQGFNVGSTVLSINQIPSHNHSFTFSEQGFNISVGGVPRHRIPTGISVDTENAGSGDPHSHGWNDLGTWRPRYEIWSAATKD